MVRVGAEACPQVVVCCQQITGTIVKLQMRLPWPAIRAGAFANCRIVVTNALALASNQGRRICQSPHCCYKCACPGQQSRAGAFANCRIVATSETVHVGRPPSQRVPLRGTDCRGVRECCAFASAETPLDARALPHMR